MIRKRLTASMLFITLILVSACSGPNATPTSAPQNVPTLVSATPNAEATSEATAAATSEATAEMTVEATSESTMAVTSEATSEMTVEATSEAAMAATSEATSEAAMAVTSEATSKMTVEATMAATSDSTSEATAEMTTTVTPETLSESYTSPDGKLTFKYPSGWSVSDTEGQFVVGGEAGVTFSINVGVDAISTQMGLPSGAELSLADGADAFIKALFGTPGSEVDTGGVKLTELGDYPAGVLILPNVDDRDQFTYLLDVDGTPVLINGSAAAGTFDEYQSTIEAIAATITLGK